MLTDEDREAFIEMVQHLAETPGSTMKIKADFLWLKEKEQKWKEFVNEIGKINYDTPTWKRMVEAAQAITCSKDITEIMWRYPNTPNLSNAIKNAIITSGERNASQ